MRVGVISPHLISRKGLCALLESLPQVSVVLDINSLLDDIESVQKVDPAVLLFDALDPALDLEVIGRTQKLLPRMKIVLLADHVDEEFELRAIKAGARGCVSKKEDPQFLAKALVVVAQGEIWISQRAGSRIIGEFIRSRDKENNRNGSSELSRREWEILSLVAQGYRNKQVANRLFVCESTIKTHLYTMYKKLQISNRLEAVLYYYHHLNRDAVPAQPVLPASLAETAPNQPAARAGGPRHAY
ncbi:MAG TPA: response regulator transcription factor [Terriglobia bacterium]|nr:response regulator transcription factor [Terriglobia bacterium]